METDHKQEGGSSLAQPPSSLSTLTALTRLHLGLFSPCDSYLIFPLHKLGPGVQALNGVHGILSRHLPPVSALWHAIPLLPSPTAMDQEGQGQIRAKDREDLSWGVGWVTPLHPQTLACSTVGKKQPSGWEQGTEGLEHGCRPASLPLHGHRSALLLLRPVLQTLTRLPGGAQATTQSHKPHPSCLSFSLLLGMPKASS